jgi:hypothetical protein
MVRSSQPAGDGLGALPTFELQKNGDVWRLEASEFQGRPVVNWRKWYRTEVGLRPAKAGVVIPLGRLRELAATLLAIHAALTSEEASP